MKYSKKSIWANRGLHLFCYVFTGFAPILCSKLLYYYAFQRKLDLKNPQTLNEKLMWLKLNTYRDNELITKCVDKYAVREYLQDLGYDELLNEITGVWTNPDEIPFDELPQRFVLKCNHGCGYNIICEDIRNFDSELAKQKLKKWIKEDFWRRFAEINYRNIPKKIICETYIEDQQKRGPIDYKFYCFNGKAQYVLVCTDRRNEKTKYYFFSREWKLQRINPDSKAAPPDFTLPRPPRLDDMFEYAEKLSAPFPFVRIDLYSSDDRILFGEFTFTPAAALDINRLPETDYMFGSLLKLPLIKEQ